MNWFYRYTGYRRQDRHLVVPFLLVTTLFFFWAFVHNINGILIPHLKKALLLSDMESAFIDVAIYIAYFLAAIPAGLLIQRRGYRFTILSGLALFALGALLFVPAAYSRTYATFLAALFIFGFGAAFLETVANPYISGLGDRGPLHVAPQPVAVVQRRRRRRDAAHRQRPHPLGHHVHRRPVRRVHRGRPAGVPAARSRERGPAVPRARRRHHRRDAALRPVPHPGGARRGRRLRTAWPSRGGCCSTPTWCSPWSRSSSTSALRSASAASSSGSRSRPPASPTGARRFSGAASPWSASWSAGSPAPSPCASCAPSACSPPTPSRASPCLASPSTRPA